MGQSTSPPWQNAAYAMSSWPKSKIMMAFWQNWSFSSKIYYLNLPENFIMHIIRPSSLF